jgi:hypothetical protein
MLKMPKKRFLVVSAFYVKYNRMSDHSAGAFNDRLLRPFVEIRVFLLIAAGVVRGNRPE